MAASSSSFATIMSENVCEGLDLFEANNNTLLMALMEETQEDDYCEEDDRLMNMIQSLEAEIKSSCSFSPAPNDFEVGEQDGQDFSTSSMVSCWEDVEEVVSARSSSSPSSSSSFDEDMMDAWSLCGADGDDNISEFYYNYGVLLENKYLTCS